MNFERMNLELMEQGIAFIEKSNANLQPELLTAADARKILAIYARARKLIDFGVAAISRKVADPSEVARVTGTSMGAAKSTVATGKIMGSSDELSSALQHGEVSLDQAKEIASAEESAPGAAADLLEVATKEPFHVLRERSRKTKLEAEQHRDLSERQHKSRFGRSFSDELGMVHIHLALEPHIGTPIVARAEAEAERIAKKATATAKSDAEEGEIEPFERYLADAYAELLRGKGKGRARRPELVVLVSHDVAERGWKDVRPGEVCKIPGVGPVSPKIARDIAEDAFLNGVVCDGKDLRQFKRWSRHIPVEVAVALELGAPPDFDGVVCVDCGNRFRTEVDHVNPRHRGGETSSGNLRPLCWSCHQAKTRRERRASRSGET